MVIGSDRSRLLRDSIVWVGSSMLLVLLQSLDWLEVRGIVVPKFMLMYSFDEDIDEDDDCRLRSKVP